MLQVTPDWSQSWTAKKAEHELKGFTFKSPGLYLSETDTILVTATREPRSGLLPSGVSIFDKGLTLWASEKHWTEDDVFRFHVYNINVKRTIFNTHIPTKADSRELFT